MPDHPVKRKLEKEILPYLVSAHLLRHQWFYRLHVLFGYTTDVLVGLTTIGLGTPLFSLFVQPSDEKAAGEPIALLDLVRNAPPWLYWLTIFVAVLWMVLRVAFNKEEGQKRAVLARSCVQTLKQVEAKLHQILVNPEPLAELGKLTSEQVYPTVDRNVQEGAWPWSGPAPGIDAEVSQRLAALCRRYEDDWAQVSTPDLRRVA